jgi:murein DD-endopeptidase MepM/ murein hydrolase activator NlpD
MLLLFLVACTPEEIEREINVTIQEDIPQEVVLDEAEDIEVPEEDLIEEKEDTDGGDEPIDEEVEEEEAPLVTPSALLSWPTDSQDVDSAFGPRLMSSDGHRYDFHRGIDIEDSLGSSIYAAMSGEVFRVYTEGEEGSPYPNGGNVVIIEHTDSVSLDGREYSKYYTHYLHLDSISVALDDVVSEGEVIGTMGSSGNTDNVHLHFEVRVGTHCSYSYQKDNPSSGCTLSPSIDPHVNPFLFLPYNNDNHVEVLVVETNPVKVRVRTSLEELDFDSIEIQNADEEKKISFNTREGIDLNSIDDSSYQGVIIEPTPLVGEYEILFTFEDFNSYESIKVSDVFGNVNEISGN